jgi:hypothetical protein
MTEADREFIAGFLGQALSNCGTPEEAARAIRLISHAIARALAFDPPPAPLVIKNNQVLIPHHDYELHPDGRLSLKIPFDEDDIIRCLRFDGLAVMERYYTSGDITADT